MNVKMTFRHMEHTPSLDDVIHHKSEKFIKWFGEKVDVHWTCWVEDRHHCAEVKIHAGHKDYFAKASAEDLYKTFDLVVQKIHNQVDKV
jgi:putative sigma-54 modulation protein